MACCLLKLCCEEVESTSLMPSADSLPPSNDVSSRSLPTKSNTSKIICKKFNIHTPDKAVLAVELVGQMKSPEKAPVR
jgi:hypothetical protein